MRLFLDANVLFSAAHSATGNARTLFRIAEVAEVELWSSAFALDEARRNLRTKSRASAEEIDSLIALLRFVGAPSTAATAAARRSGLPDKDAPVLAAALTLRADLLVTGDRRHFGALLGKSFEAVEIETPAEAVKRLLARAERRLGLRR